MERNQALVVILLVVLVLFSVALAGYVANSGGGAKGLAATARFTAKPGTTRQNAVALSTSKRTAPTQPAPGASGDGVRVRSLTPEEPRVAADESRISPEVREALNAWRPEQGMEKLERLLEDPSLSDGERAEVLAALGVLAGQLDTPDFERAARCFSQALQLDLPPAQRARIAFEDAQLLMRQGQFDEALSRVVAERDRQPPGTRALQLDLLYATLEERRGDAATAERVYAAALEQAMAVSGSLDAQTEDMLRMAALRLSRLYRETGRAEEAGTLSRRFTEALAANP